MGATTQDLEFLDRVRIYVSNAGYPSIHVYTVDARLQNYMRYQFDARVVPHIGTEDVVVSNRKGLGKAAIKLYAHGRPELRPLAATLLKYCRMERPEARKRVALRLSLQLRKLRAKDLV